MKECNICQDINCRMVDRGSKIGRITLQSNSPCHKAVVERKKFRRFEKI